MRSARGLRDLLAAEPTTREISVFDGRALLVDDRVIVRAGKGGDLLVRVPAERSGELRARPGATQAEMGTGRSIGPEWIAVAAEAIAADAALADWLTVALENHRARR